MREPLVWLTGSSAHESKVAYFCIGANNLGAWIKLSGWYRLQAVAPYAELHGAIRRMAGLMGERLVWGSDWPHKAFEPSKMPAYASLWAPVVDALGPD